MSTPLWWRGPMSRIEPCRWPWSGPRGPWCCGAGRASGAGWNRRGGGEAGGVGLERDPVAIGASAVTGADALTLWAPLQCPARKVQKRGPPVTPSVALTRATSPWGEE